MIHSLFGCESRKQLLSLASKADEHVVVLCFSLVWFGYAGVIKMLLFPQ